MPACHVSRDRRQLSGLENSHSPASAGLLSLQSLRREGCKAIVLTLVTPRQAIPIFPVLSLFSIYLLLHLLKSTEMTDTHSLRSARFYHEMGTVLRISGSKQDEKMVIVLKELNT